MKEIKLKEIKPGMVIHYKNDEEKKLLLKELGRLGYVWSNSGELPTQNLYIYIGNVIHVYIRDGYKTITHSMNLSVVTHEFSDLILPETMTEEEAYKKGREDAFEEVKNCEAYGYECGLKDAWELAKKMVLNTYDGGIDAKELEKMFGVQDSYTIFKENDVKDVLAKVEAYEKKIKVGDVISLRGVEAVVTCIYPDDTFDGIKITADDKHGRLGGVYAGYHLSSWEKTGKHIDLSTILAEIGKE